MNEEIIKKLQALLRMTTDRGCTQGEMENAMVMAQKLAFKHRINLDELRDCGENETIDLGKNIVKKTYKCSPTNSFPSAHRYFCCIIDRYFGVKTITIEGEGKIGVVGNVTDVDFAIYVYSYLRGTFKKLWYVAKFELVLEEFSRGSFYVGLWESLNAKLNEAQESAKKEAAAEYKSGFELVLVDFNKALQEKFDEFYPESRKMRGRAPTVKDEGAYRDGLAKGRKININQPLSNKK